MSELAGASFQVKSGFDRAHFSGGSELRLAQVAPAEIGGRFCAWRGRSEQRYVMTVYPVDGTASDGGLPEFEECVVLAIGRGPLGRNVLDVAVVEQGRERRATAARGIGLGAVEWHVSFVGGDRAERAAIVADLHARHGRVQELAQCA